MTDNIVTKTRTDYLPCRLTDEELRERGDELAAVVQDMAAEEDRQKDEKARLKARITELEAKRSQLAITIRRREERRDVEVVHVTDYDRGVETKTRTDTGEVIGERVLSDNERQMGLPGTGHAD